MTFFEFADRNPWLTFFLALILGDLLIRIFNATVELFGSRK